MPADITKNGRNALPASIPSADGLPGLTPPPPDAADAGLSAAFRLALGGKAGQPHLPGSGRKAGQEIARLARTEKPAAPKGRPRKTHIGPRSGHK